MAEDDKLKYSDIIEPDDSIEKLVTQLGELNRLYETTVRAIKDGADKIARSIKSASGATKEGRQAIDEAAVASSRLERAQYELRLALSDTGKQIAWLKAQTSDANKATVEQQRYILQAVSSYDRLKSDLKEAVELYKSLTAAERLDNEMGGQLLDTIINLKNQIKFLDDQLKPHAVQLTEVEKAEARLVYLQSDEGQKLLDLKAKIAELTSARKQHKEVIDPLVRAQEKLAYATSDENQQLKAYTIQIQEANQIAKLQAQIANSAEGSYNRLSAQYALNKIKLNQMSAAEREAVDVGKKLEEETLALYEQMRKLQEATGNYRLSVGHYQRAWDGLGFSISQVVRELPAMAVSANTFFLAISNNIPLVADEINRLRMENKKLQAEGKPTINIAKNIARAILSWNSALVIILSVFSVWGKDIVEWVTSLFKAKNAVISTTEALKNIAKELEDTNGSYGNNIVKVKMLQEEWKSLKTVAEKNQWIKDNKSNFDQLGISVNKVTDAENVFVDNTEAVINALKLRAKAAAAQKLAADKYEEALVKQNEAELERQKRSKTRSERIVASVESTQTPAAYATPGAIAEASKIDTYREATERVTKEDEKAVQAIKDKAAAAEKTADAYFEMADSFEKAAKAELKAADIEGKHKTTKTRKGREPRDLTRTINQNDIKIQREYEESVTELLKDEYAKRRKAAADQVQDENNKLREMYRLNEEYVSNVDGKYKELTEDQKTQIAKQQELITKTIANNLKALGLQLQQLQNEQKVASLRIMRNTINATEAPQSQGTTVTTNTVVTRDASQMEASLVEERKLMEKNLDIEYALILDTNKRLLEAGDDQARSEEEILIELNRKKLELWSDYDQKILDAREQDIEKQLELVKKGSDEELKLLLEQNEVRRQLALAENAAKPAEQQISTDTINELFNKYAKQVSGSFQMTSFDEQQALDEAVFNEIKHNETEITKFKLQQEKARWQEQIRLAEAGSLDWSQAQIDAAKSTIKGIERELNELDDFFASISEKGLGKTLLERLGFDEDQIDAIQEAVNFVIEQFQSILDAEVELAEQAVKAAEKRVEAAQSAYEAEVEARSNGYANNVATAKKELQQEKKKQLERQKILEAAQKKQEALNTITQASNLITASSLIWSQLGFPWAIPALAAMWTSFAVAKIKAKQVTASQSEEYGEGGLEFLEGGSHASGNDIDLRTKNSKGKNMRAEGGEALAIINKKRTKKYKGILPDVIDSLNKGTFEDKYMNAFASTDGMSLVVSPNDGIDLSKLEDDVRNIRKQNETKYCNLGSTTLIIKGNVKRYIKR